MIRRFFFGGQSMFDLNQYMDLINLESADLSYFTVAGSSISNWAEVGGTNWAQGTSLNRPTLTGGIPIFDGSNDQLIRASELNLGTQFSLYVVFKDTGALSKILLSAQSNSDYIMHDSGPSSLYDRIQMATGGVTRQGWTAGIKGNRYVILSIRRNGNTVTAKINDRTLLARTTNFAGQNTTFARLCGFTSGGFNMGAGVKAVCASSQVLSDEVDAQVINYLYTTYGLSSDTAAESMTGFGDSNTVGQGVSSYLIAAASSKGVRDHNLGISGSRLTALDANSGITRWQSQIPTRPYTDYIVIQYGTNDILGGVSASTFATALNTVVGGLIAAGYPAAKICLCSNPYQQSGANATELDSYRTEIETIKNTYGTRYANLLQDTRDNGGNSLLSDLVHLNATGQTRWANLVTAAFA